MFGVDTSELLLIAIIALVFVGPKDLPKAMRTVGQWVGKARAMARHFTAGIQTMVRDAELEEMERKWREENERIMQLHPPEAHYPDPQASPDAQASGSAEPHQQIPVASDQDPVPPAERPLP
jgi:sec-independent protein translocase protein TatB